LGAVFAVVTVPDGLSVDIMIPEVNGVNSLHRFRKRLDGARLNPA